MNYNSSFHLTKSEQQVMDVLWSSDNALSNFQIIELAEKSGEKSFKDRTIFSLLKTLQNKDLIRVVNFTRSGKSYARTFLPTMSRAEWYARKVCDTLTSEELKEFQQNMAKLLAENCTS